MSIEYIESDKVATSKNQWNRSDVISKVIEFENCKETKSQRQFSDSQGVARTTLQYWLKRKSDIDASPALIFFLKVLMAWLFCID